MAIKEGGSNSNSKSIMKPKKATPKFEVQDIIASTEGGKQEFYAFSFSNSFVASAYFLIKATYSSYYFHYDLILSLYFLTFL